eukprot:Hpha_TRINITY_DN14867_c4_g11::TRINITY_DN14867_c4_g11_i1::g.169029::m.169029
MAAGGMLGALIVACGVAAEGQQDLLRPRVRIPGIGTVRGSRSNHVESFLGIPYAPPPIRWQPPGPQPSWKGVREAVEFGSTCMGSQCGCSSVPGAECNWTKDAEDCLFLNVFRPAKGRTGIPVMVFIHGGAYQTGCSNVYQAATFMNAAEQSFVYVSINYRLGPFGFLGSEKLRAEDGSTGNFGFQDQRAALRWVKDNIAAFGGDPKRITIFGESAGAGSVAAHLVSRRSWPLFDHAIAQSGAGSIWNTKPMESAEAALNAVLSRADCDTVYCLRQANASYLLGLGNGIPTTKGYSPWSPVVDGVEFVETVWRLAEKGEVKNCSVVIGSNRDEGALFSLMENQPRNMTEAEFDTSVVQKHLGSPATLPTLKRLYAEANYPYPKLRGDFNYWWWALEALTTDRDFACPNRRFARNLKRAGVKVFNYYLVHPSQTKTSLFPGTGPGSVLVPHAEDIQFVFGCADPSVDSVGACTSPLTGEGEIALSHDFINAWTTLAATAAPGAVGGVEWPEWPESPSVGYERTSLEFDISRQAGGSGIIIGGPAIDEQCDFWDPRMA